jgi:hypothetical protein
MKRRLKENESLLCKDLIKLWVVFLTARWLFNICKNTGRKVANFIFQFSKTSEETLPATI